MKKTDLTFTMTADDGSGHTSTATGVLKCSQFAS